MNHEPLALRLAAGLPGEALEPPMAEASHAVSWAAVIAGATGAAALSLILLVLGTGLGLSSVSPWSDRGASAATFGVSTILWVTLTQVAAAGMGGYLAGRLRARWRRTHTDEVYFRDTAHGFLAWALATLVTAALLSSAIGSVLAEGAKAGASITGAAAATLSGATNADGAANANAYAVDALFRKDPAAPEVSAASLSAADRASTSAEITRILANGIAAGSLPPDDARYVGQLVAQRTGLSPADAEKRVTDGFARVQSKAREAQAVARDTADKARKASAYAALWLFVSLLAGAFCASWAATYGGRRRDLF